MSSYAVFMLTTVLWVTAVLVSGVAANGCPRRPHPLEECPNCRLTTETSGYLADPCNETCYYQCEIVKGEWTIAEPICCPCCTVFNVTLVTCVRDPNATCETPVTMDKDFNCTLQPQNDPTCFLMGNESIRCSEGTLFKEKNCTCIHDPDYPPPISMNYTIRSEVSAPLFEFTVEMATSKSPFIVMIRQAMKLYPNYRYTSKAIRNLGDYILSVNGIHEASGLVWVFVKEQDGKDCIPDLGVNQYRVQNGEHLILSLLPSTVYADTTLRCP